MPRGGHSPLEVDRALVWWPRGKRAFGRRQRWEGPHRYIPNLGLHIGGDSYFVLGCCDTVMSTGVTSVACFYGWRTVLVTAVHATQCRNTFRVIFNPLNSELNPICYLLSLLGAHHFLHVSRIRVKSLTLRLLMSYTGCPRRKGQNFERVFLMLKYTDITQNTYIQS